MTVQITIIGMGQIGASVGLALANQKELVQRTGHDKDVRIARLAEKMGAVDKVALNLPNSVRNADLVLLALPIDQIRETLSIIAADLKESAVVMDTAPVKEIVAAWAKELLPPDRHYIGLTPVLAAEFLQVHDSGINAANADLFRKGLMAIVVPPQTPSEAVKLAADLTRLLGANPLFADPVEVDSLMASTHILPQLISAALINITVDQPGWREGRKLAGRAYSEVTGPAVLLGGPETLTSSALLNTENILRVTDSLIAALQTFRSDIKNQDAEALTGRLERARAGRELWWQQRQAADWATEEGGGPVELPKASETFGRLFGIGGGKPKEKK